MITASFENRTLEIWFSGRVRARGLRDTARGHRHTLSSLWRPSFPRVFWHLAEVYISGGQRHQKWSTCSLCVLCGRHRGLAGGPLQLACADSKLSLCATRTSAGREHICAKRGPKRLTGLSSFKIALGCLLLFLVWMRWGGTREFEGMHVPSNWWSWALRLALSFLRRWPQSHGSTVSSWLLGRCRKSFLLNPDWFFGSASFP